MKKTLSFLIGISLLLCCPLLAQNDIIHTVKKGDTLWDISEHYLKTPWQWPLIWSENDYITNPHLIYPGDKVVIGKDANGRTVIKVIPSSGSPYEFSEKNMSAKSFMLSPQMSGLKFSTTPLSGSGKVLGQQDVGTMACEGDTILLKLNTNVAVGQRLNILALEDVVKNGKTTVGYLYQTSAIARVSKINDDGLVEAVIKSSTREVEKDQIVLAGAPAVTPKRIAFRSPTLNSRGLVIDIFDGVSSGIKGSRFDLAFIDLGQNQGAQTGDLLDVFKIIEVKENPKSKTSPTLTSRVYTGMIMVLDAKENSSMCLVLDSRDSITKGLAVGVLK